jgi:hypothetical protein
VKPTKWLIWTLCKFGLVSKLPQVSREKILFAELAEAQRQLKTTLARPGLTEGASAYIASAYHRLQAAAQQWTQRKAEQFEITRDMLAELRKEIRAATSTLQLFGSRQREPA